MGMIQVDRRRLVVISLVVLTAIFFITLAIGISTDAYGLSMCGGKKPENQPAYCTTTTTATEPTTVPETTVPETTTTMSAPPTTVAPYGGGASTPPAPVQQVGTPAFASLPRTGSNNWGSTMLVGFSALVIGGAFLWATGYWLRRKQRHADWWQDID
jgi:LPXTG-motif cell wall-anchored protein